MTDDRDIELLRRDPDEHEDVPTRVDAAVRQLGSIDAQIRDDLAAGLLMRWVGDGTLDDVAVAALFETLTGPDVLFDRIGERGTTSVLRRSFAMLVLAAIASRIRTAPGPVDPARLAEAVVRYAGQELDLRTTIPGCGWAHAIAHTADVIDELVADGGVEREARAPLVHALLTMFDRADEVVQGEEDERVALPVLQLLGNGDHQVPASALGAIDEDLDPERARIVRINRKLLVRSAIGRLERAHPDERVTLDELRAVAVALAPF